ncbi:MAG: DUF456 domain-containing protein [Planctomycetaceae bacterium]|nr:DUF456 domain-containing protein [Planctomycetaceae bacterium]
MFYVWGTVLVLFNAIFFVMNLFGLPGNWLIVLAMGGFAWWQWNPALSPWAQPVSLQSLILLLVLAILGEIIEFVAGLAGARKASGSWWGSIGALGGSLVGAAVGTFVIPIPLLGTLIGACAGAFAGALLFEMASGKPLKPAVAVGKGAGIGRLLGTVGKMAVGVIMLIAAAIAIYWP